MTGGDMRAVIQRVKRAGVKIFPGGAEKGRIGAGLLVLLAVEDSDSSEDAAWLASKICGLRVFEDGDGKMNLSVADIGGEVMAVSQFTLYGNVRKGFRPSFNRSARPETAEPLYGEFVSLLSKELGREVPTGEFGAMMEIDLLNDGPVTIIIDTKDRNF